ncbi:hypothetical protein BO83DRAFT_424187 [Aspergillus eucalypticola CBS 122712]|uniref:Uncharacterized protein n=1 Tax=Aspergillus eucalypticola (strain CBS 122712 / IBT 29274) TaxID=1448314 RepID=A0A317W1S5_ASPEC|nr:uncharacterized protein BO83DRAFT_424187 [Aspergillus eucalypticola CBS 122712]PWY79839.1 hypothetical protein BO83DRAFT_424187 [Aspergillus eucalypticola CBS 122712]
MQIAGPSHMAEQHVAQRTGPNLGLTGFVFVVVVNVALTDPYAWGQNRSLLLDRDVLILGWDSSDGAHIYMLSRMSPYYL